jgi:DNA-binding NarL/FixJ family response regulator
MLFFLLCDDLPDGELEQAVLLLQDLPAERRRVLAVLADQSDQQRLQRLLELGLDGLCSQSSCGQGRIYTAVDAIASGGFYIEPQFRQRLLPTSGAEAPDAAPPPEPVPPASPAPAATPLAPEDLSHHERELLRELCLGFNSQEIATHRGMTYQSVRRTLSLSYQRLGVRDRAQAIGWCVAHGLIPLEELQRHYGGRGPLAGG